MGEAYRAGNAAQCSRLSVCTNCDCVNVSEGTDIRVTVTLPRNDPQISC
jgi:hypothetical protein